MPQNPRYLYVRLPADLMDTLEEARFHCSRRIGKRASLRALVEASLQSFLSDLKDNAETQRILDSGIFAATDNDTPSDTDDPPAVEDAA